MRLAIIGAQSTGKSSLINEILREWPMYSIPEKSYRDIVTERNLPLNETGTLESQMIIRDVLIDMALENAGKQHTVHDRCTIDNLVYSLWLVEHNRLGEDAGAISDFLAGTINMVRETMKFYDIIFWTPVDPHITIPERDGRSIDPLFRTEIDNLFEAVYDNYKTNTGLLFDKENQPTMIPLRCRPDERLDIIRSYIGPDGDLLKVEGSAILDMQTAYEEECLRRQVR